VNPHDLKASILEAIGRVVERTEYVRSATVAGSFGSGTGVEGIADIDTIVVVDRLDADRIADLQRQFREALEPLLAEQDLGLRINATLGPLKFNDPRTAVLHLMVYSVEAHREHAIRSPFTCLDWQRSPLWYKASLKQVYPVFGLQPRHFFSARRGTKDYLADLARGAITYRELQGDAEGYREVARQKPMSARDRHEFAYHVMRFLMQNFLKLVRRNNEAEDGPALLDAYFARFGEERETFGALFERLRQEKVTGSFTFEAADLTARVAAFVDAFERQFRKDFEQRASRHLVFRHAPTAWNRPEGESRIFQGRMDPELASGVPEGLDELARAAAGLRPQRSYSSPSRRAVGSLMLLAERLSDLPPPILDERLMEMACGDCEGMSVGEARRRYPELFAAWRRREDPCFPGGGENTAAVFDRAWAFVEERLTADSPGTLTCTHNVVLRCLVGHLLGVPREDWFRLRIPHVKPATIVATARFGRFVELDEEVERSMFAAFGGEASRK